MPCVHKMFWQVLWADYNDIHPADKVGVSWIGSKKAGGRSGDTLLLGRRNGIQCFFLCEPVFYFHESQHLPTSDNQVNLTGSSTISPP